MFVQGFEVEIYSFHHLQDCLATVVDVKRECSVSYRGLIRISPPPRFKCKVSCCEQPCI